jgi:hypothetical protein
MDDFVISNLNESRNEWCGRLISIFTPLVNEGVRSIFNEAWKLCLDNNEANKYLMTFQNLLSRVPKWNNVIVEEERKRIIERSGCNYLEDLITCVHIIQLKALTCIRVGNKQKKIDITIPKLDTFIHKVYINVARKVYTNVFLFEKNINPLQMQKNNREFEVIIQECILTAIRESIPTESIIRAYMEESVEQDEEVFIEPVPEEAEKVDTATEVESTKSLIDENIIPEVVPAIKNIDEEQVVTRLTFNEMDSVLDEDNTVKSVSAPKNIERLEEISTARAIQRKLDEEEDDDEERIKISSDTIDLSGFDVLDNDKVDILTNDFMLDGVEELA